MSLTRARVSGRQRTCKLRSGEPGSADSAPGAVHIRDDVSRDAVTWIRGSQSACAPRARARTFASIHASTARRRAASSDVTAVVGGAAFKLAPAPRAKGTSSGEAGTSTDQGRRHCRVRFEGQLSAASSFYEPAPSPHDALGRSNAWNDDACSLRPKAPSRSGPGPKPLDGLKVHLHQRHLRARGRLP